MEEPVVDHDDIRAIASLPVGDVLHRRRDADEHDPGQALQQGRQRMAGDTLAIGQQDAHPRRIAAPGAARIRESLTMLCGQLRTKIGVDLMPRARIRRGP